MYLSPFAISSSKSSIAVDKSTRCSSKTFSFFWQAVLFQWLNPKAWTMTVVAPSIAMFHTSQPWLDNYLLLALCAMVNIVSISFWAAGGHWLQKLVHLPSVMRVIHAVIVIMTLYCALTIWI